MWIRRLRREKLRKRPFPPIWRLALEEELSLYRNLGEADRRELHGHIQVFLAEKRFEGAGGLVVTEVMKLLVAAQACLLLLHRDTDYFPGLYSVVIYPSEYLARRRDRDEAGVVVERLEARAGESWPRGTVVLAWNEVQLGAAGLLGCRNVVIHEFAHLLDYENGEADGAPALPERGLYRPWARAWSREYARLQAALAGGENTFIDPYGAENPAEFFAVVVEAFFTCPRGLLAHHPDLYRLLERYFQQDPASWLPR
jgi:Mlc titration factor MtfA (ptsG expression regulator)